MNQTMTKVAFRPVGLLLGAGAGLLAGALFRQLWKIAAGEDDAPDPMDENRGWGEVLAAAAVQGAIFAVVRAAVDRAAASGVRRMTGRWPG